MDYKFKPQLIEGLVRSRPNRFIMMVSIRGKIFKCHCPSTGRIGNLEFRDVPCLLSKATNKKRTTSYTVEAISLQKPRQKNKQWIGINQTKVNHYLEFFLQQGRLTSLVKNFKDVKREQPLGHSRIDFKVANTFIEVKMPLITLPTNQQSKRKYSPFNSFDRLIKHFTDLGHSLPPKTKGIILMCYMYKAQPFQPPVPVNKPDHKIQRAARQAIARGVAIWQANLQINSRGVKLLKYFKLNLFKL
jgi:sugar fermentation stimulation protein A